MRNNLLATQREKELQDGKTLMSNTDTHTRMAFVIADFRTVSGFNRRFAAATELHPCASDALALFALNSRK